MFKPKIINDNSLSAIPDSMVAELGRTLRQSGFTAPRLLKYFGKEVLRHINITHMEEDFLRRQILHTNPMLRGLVDLFLLNRLVDFKAVAHILGADLTHGMIDCGLFERNDEKLVFRGFLTPLENGLFLNDGDLHDENPGHVIKIVLEQPYLIKAISMAADCVGISRSARILDICSGSGVIGQAIQSDGLVTGWDINPRAINYARFNARLNNLSSAKYLLRDVLKPMPLNEEYDIIVANPPYNAHVPTSRNDDIDITLHSGIFGCDIPSEILGNVDRLLASGGVFAMCGIQLMKNGELAHSAIEEMAANGTVVVLHKVISPAETWEGMRCQYNCTPGYGDLPDGRILDLVSSADFFNEVTWAITLWHKGGNPGYFNIYNLPTDGVLLSPQAIRDIKEVLG